MESRATHTERSPRSPPRDEAKRNSTGTDPGGPAGKLAWTVTVQEVLGLLRRRWVIPVLRELASGTKRRFQLHHAIRGVTPKVLTETLRFLERDGVIERVLHDDGHGSKSIAYRLTDLGGTLAQPIESLYDWGHDHLDDVHQCQRETDALWTTDRVPQGARGSNEVSENPLQ